MFSGKTIVITGGASGIGAAIGRRFGAAGARVGLLDFDRNTLKTASAELTASGIEVIGIECDVTSVEQCAEAIWRVIELWGGIDILVANAGVTQRSPFVETKVAVFRSVMEVNFFGALNITKAAISSLIERQGMIIVSSSHAGYSPLIGRSGYSASKHALHGLFKSMRSELTEQGVHVMMLCPGFTKTNLQSRALGADGSLAQHPQSTVGKIDSPERVAEAVYRGALKRRRILVLTAVGKISYLLHRLSPGLFEKIMARKLRSEISSRD